jgi:hypothetical protein
MSSGPVTVAEQVLGGDHRPAAVVRVDVGHLPVVERAAAQHERHPGHGEDVRQRVLAVQRHEDHAVDVALPGVAADLLLLALVAGGQQHQVEVGVGQRGRQPAHDAGEEGVGEDLGVGLVEHQRDGVGAPGDQAAGHPVGHVAQLGDGGLHRLPRLGAHPRGVVDDPGHRRPRDAGEHGDLVQRR